MESSSIAIKWFNCLDNTLYKLFTMTEEKINKINSLHKIISDLKSNPSVDSKKTIQKLQQELDNIVNE